MLINILDVNGIDISPIRQVDGDDGMVIYYMDIRVATPGDLVEITLHLSESAVAKWRAVNA